MTKRKLKKALPPMVILRDTREQLGYLFDTIKPLPIIRDVGLKTGDYSIEGLETKIAVERKTLSDAYGTFGRGRTRFEKELRRMAQLSFAVVIIEADWLTILRQPPKRSRMNPRAVYASIIAWSQRYNVHFLTCPDRAFAEKTTFRILERYWLDHTMQRKE
jgi:DNA excision repair protein ERCC-4